MKLFRPSPPSLDSADFTGPVFPEHAFPPLAVHAETYYAACRRGYAVMAETRVAITGLARNIGRVLPLTIQRIENLGRCFADYSVIIYENDSTDDTRRELVRWARGNRRVQLVTEVLADPVNPTTRCLARAARMARYRRRCQQEVLTQCNTFDAAIVIDCDIQGGFSIDGIASSFGHTGWDFVGANGLICRRDGLQMNALRQYDTWALRFDAHLTPLSTRVASHFLYDRGTPLVPVTCCFGGLGIYAMPAYAAGTYSEDDLEHATFHRSMIAGGHSRLFLNPSQLVIYGRRHRFGDGFVAGLLRLLHRDGGHAELFSRGRTASAGPPPAIARGRRAA